MAQKSPVSATRYRSLMALPRDLASHDEWQSAQIPKKTTSVDGWI
jgi:hypothetical protein